MQHWSRNFDSSNVIVRQIWLCNTSCTQSYTDIAVHSMFNNVGVWLCSTQIWLRNITVQQCRCMTVYSWYCRVIFVQLTQRGFGGWVASSSDPRKQPWLSHCVAGPSRPQNAPAAGWQTLAFETIQRCDIYIVSQIRLSLDKKLFWSRIISSKCVYTLNVKLITTLTTNAVNWVCPALQLIWQKLDKRFNADAPYKSFL